jgi:hypothetical protein
MINKIRIYFYIGAIHEHNNQVVRGTDRKKMH